MFAAKQHMYDARARRAEPTFDGTALEGTSFGWARLKKTSLEGTSPEGMSRVGGLTVGVLTRGAQLKSGVHQNDSLARSFGSDARLDIRMADGIWCGDLLKNAGIDDSLGGQQPTLHHQPVIHFSKVEYAPRSEAEL